MEGNSRAWWLCWVLRIPNAPLASYPDAPCLPSQGSVIPTATRSRPARGAALIRPDSLSAV
jgi:hypothetical protein